ncbi:MAG: sigma factor-like helix-turn-helix DNA-binding protein [bacterium]
MSYKEIAKFLSCPEGSVMSGLYNAREKLKNKLKDYIA